MPAKRQTVSKARYEQKLRSRFEQLLKDLDQYVVAQQDAKAWLAMAASEHEHRVVLPEGAPRVILLVGPTGSGKTELCRTLAKVMDVPFHRFDASQMSHTSFTGGQLGDIMSGLIRDLRVKGRTDQAVKHGGEDEDDWMESSVTNGVVMIDEFDKIAYVQESRATSTQERHNEAVQANLLPLFEGKSLPGVGGSGVDASFDASGLLLLAGGAFNNPQVEVLVKQRETERLTASQGIWPLIQHEDLIRFGFLPELVGRIRAIVALKPLDARQYSEILVSNLKKTAYQVLGRQIAFEEGVGDVLARRAAGLNLGARAVGIVFEKVKLHIFLKVPGIDLSHSSGQIVLTMEYALKYWPESF